MEDCIFCKIVKEKIESVKIWEDDKFVAILDINPNVKGMTLVLSKEHHDSYLFDLPDKDYIEFMIVTRKVARILEKGLGVMRVAMVMEGMGINHAHIKLYPLHGIMDKFKEMWAKDKVYFEKYQGYISTQLGPQINLKELSEISKEIKKNNHQKT